MIAPFFYRPIDAMKNLGTYLISFVIFFFSYSWWTVIVVVYGLCNLDDVTWGNRPSNSSKGMNVAVSDEKRQEILRQSYRKTRTHVIIGWMLANILATFMIDSLVLSAVHNGNAETRSLCASIIKGQVIFTVCYQGGVVILSACHTIVGNFKLTFLSKYQPTRIHPRPPVSSDPETRVLLDDTDEDMPDPLMNKKKAKKMGKNKSEFETNDDVSYLSEEIESTQFMQKYGKGSWTY